MDELTFEQWAQKTEEAMGFAGADDDEVIGHLQSIHDVGFGLIVELVPVTAGQARRAMRKAWDENEQAISEAAAEMIAELEGMLG